MTATRLLVRIDGALVGEEEARGLWQRFSEHMETNRGDLAGFATREGFASIHPGIEGGRPVLIASRTSPQKPYRSASAEGGSPSPRPAGGNSAGPRRKPRRGRS